MIAVLVKVSCIFSLKPNFDIKKAQYKMELQMLSISESNEVQLIDRQVHQPLKRNCKALEYCVTSKATALTMLVLGVGKGGRCDVRYKRRNMERAWCAPPLSWLLDPRHFLLRSLTIQIPRLTNLIPG